MRLRLTYGRYDGASIGEPYEFPAHVGDRPTRVLRNHKTYTGSCHCGALTLAVNIRLDGPNPDVQECACVVCRVVSASLASKVAVSNVSHQGGCTWVYPSIGQAVIAGDVASAGRYKTERHGFVFCKTCGVIIANEVIGSTDGIAIVEHKSIRGGQGGQASIHAVNARILHDVEPAMRKMLDS